MEDELLNEISEIIWKTKGLRSQDEIMLVAATVSASKKILTLIRKREIEKMLRMVDVVQGYYEIDGMEKESAFDTVNKIRDDLEQQLKEVSNDNNNS
jgi:hypothetical protein